MAQCVRATILSVLAASFGGMGAAAQDRNLPGRCEALKACNRPESVISGKMAGIGGTGRRSAGPRDRSSGSAADRFESADLSPWSRWSGRLRCALSIFASEVRGAGARGCGCPPPVHGPTPEVGHRT
jgi:hypothetical protein